MPPFQPSAGSGRQPRIEIEWGTANIKTILFWVGIVLAIILLAGYSYYRRYYGPDAPRVRAQNAVFTAQDLYTRAKEVARGSYFAEVVKTAGEDFFQAKDALSLKDYQTAEALALDSQRSSREILDYIESKDRAGPTARFVRLEGGVQVKKKAESRWIPAELQMGLDPGDLVRTRPDSSAQVVFFDGVSLIVAPSSLMEVQLRGVTRDGLSRNPNIKLTVGAVDLSTPKFNIAGTEPSLSTETLDATLENDTDLHVTRDDAIERTELRVSGSGGADVRDRGGQQERVAPNEGLRVDGSGAETKMVRFKLPRAPLLVLPADLKVFYEAPKEGVMLRWQRIREASRYHVQVADSSLWGHLVLEKSDVEGDPELRLPALDPGDYFWRVATVSPDGKESAMSQYRRFTLPDPEARKRKLTEDSAPPKLRVLKKMVFENIIILAGETEPGATVSVNDEQVEVMRDGRFTHFAVLYHEGPTLVTVVARDVAGNEARKKIRVNVTIF